MTLPLQTWIYPTFPQGVASPHRPREFMAAIKAALDAWTAGHWEVDHYTANSRMTIRRKGSPAGVAGTFRAVIFGSDMNGGVGPFPVQPALAGNSGSIIPQSGDVLYCGVNEDAGAVAPLDPLVNPPWSTETSKFTGGISMGATNAAWNGECNISMFSSDRMLAIMGHNTQGTWFWLVFGEIVERASNGAGIWGVVGSSTLTAAADMSQVISSPVPGADGWTCYGAYYDGTPKRLVRCNGVAPYNSHSPLASVDGAGILCPIVMATGQMMDPTARQMIGILRQMRMGPYETGRKIVRDTGGTVLAISVNGAPTTASSGLYLDQRA